MGMLRPASKITTLMSTLRARWSSYISPKNPDSEILELKILNHLYFASTQLNGDHIKVRSSTLQKAIPREKYLSPFSIFNMSLEILTPDSKLKRQNLSLFSEAALSQLSSPSVSPSDRDLLLVSAALITRSSSSSTLRPAILSGLASSDRDTAATLRLLYVAGLVRLRLPASVWQRVQRRLADRATALSEPDLVALSSASFRCGARITSSRLQQRLLAAARRLTDGDPHTGSLIALLKALRLARVPCTPLLASLRSLVVRRGADLPLPAAAHLAACWCVPPVRDEPLLATLEETLRRRLQTLLDSPPDVRTAPPDVRTAPPDVSADTAGGSTSAPSPPPSAGVPDGRPKDVARLLYTLSHLGHALDSRTAGLTERWLAGWSVRRPLPLVDALLSLAILGRYPQTLLEAVLTEQVAQRLAGAS